MDVVVLMSGIPPPSLPTPHERDPPPSQPCILGSGCPTHPVLCNWGAGPDRRGESVLLHAPASTATDTPRGAAGR